MRMQPINEAKSGLDHKDCQLLKRLNTPAKIQDFLNSLPFNFEQKGETHHSVRLTLKHGRVHCFEGALLAAAPPDGGASRRWRDNCCALAQQ